MEGTNCNGEGGWTRVAFVNTSQPNATCPTGLTKIEMSGITLCTREANTVISSTVFSTLGLNYSAVCGRLEGYQDGRPEAFTSSGLIDQHYVDGVSITHGTNPRKHVWTYAVGRTENSGYCPCYEGNSGITIPSFVGDNYYCESGIDTNAQFIFYPNDPLWDGMQCNGRESTCCTNGRMPWFNTTLSDTSNDDLEIRIMFSGLIRQGEDSPLDLIELYIR